MGKIKKMSPEDIAEVLALWKNTDGVGLDPELDTRRGIKAYLKRNPGLSFVALDGSRLVGAALCGTDGRRGYLHHLAVKPSHRRRDVGRHLVERCLAALRRIGIDKCHIFIFKENRSGILFWKKIGWRDRKDLGIMSRPIN